MGSGELEETVPATEAAADAPGRIGRFEITGLLGRGGMGVVLAARDPELDRRVAIKLLLAGGSGDRLQREAQAMAKLAHPNVVSVYEVGRVDDRAYVAMELVEGQTLRQWLASPHPWREIVEMFIAAGRGLAAAHEAGLVHRDFKPENVLVGADRRPRVADFGLVTTERRAVHVHGESVAHSLTVDGAVVGTPAYMAPEQWAGDEVAARSDQFSFCVALWEALYGRRPFAGTSFEALRAAVIAGTLIAVPAAPDLPRRLHAAIVRGLDPDPAARWASMTELLDVLDACRAPARRAPWLALGALGIGAGIAVAVVAARPHDAEPPPRPVVAPVPDAAPGAAFVVKRDSLQRRTFADTCEEAPTFARDGTTIFYDAALGPNYHLFSVDAVQGSPRELTTTVGWDINPAPSPDGKQLAFLRFADGDMSLYIGELGHLETARLVALSNLRPSWTPDGHIWTAVRDTLERRDPIRGTIERTLPVERDHLATFVIELPDGRLVALLHPLDDSAQIDRAVLYAATGGEPVVLHRGSMGPVLAMHPDGESIVISVLAANRSVELWQQPLDPRRPARQLTNGMVPAHSGLAIAGRRLAWSDCRAYMYLATVRAGQDRTLGYAPLSRNDWGDMMPIGIPGTTEVAFLSDRAGRFELFRQDLRLRGEPVRIPLGALEPVAFDISRDATFLVAGEGSTGLYYAPIAGGEPRLLFAESGDLQPSIDRRGKTVYFERHDGEQYRIAAIDIAGGAPRWVAGVGSHAPAASPTADVLAYIDSPTTGSRAMLLDLATGKTRRLEPGAPDRPLGALRWSPDGTRILIVEDNVGVTEVDVKTGKPLRVAPIGANQLAGATYVGDDIIVGHQVSAGDIWTGELE